MGHQRQESQAHHEVKASMEWRAVVQECWSLLRLHLGFGHVCKGLQGTSADRCVPFHVCFTPSLLMIVIIFATHTHICCPKNLIKFVSFLLQMRLRRQWLTRWCKASQMGALVNVWSIFDVVGFDVVSFWLMFLFKVKIVPETKGLPKILMHCFCQSLQMSRWNTQLCGKITLASSLQSWGPMAWKFRRPQRLTLKKQKKLGLVVCLSF